MVGRRSGRRSVVFGVEGRPSSTACFAKPPDSGVFAGRCVCRALMDGRAYATTVLRWARHAGRRSVVFGVEGRPSSTACFAKPPDSGVFAGRCVCRTLMDGRAYATTVLRWARHAGRRAVVFGVEGRPCSIARFAKPPDSGAFAGRCVCRALMDGRAYATPILRSALLQPRLLRLDRGVG
jgi:hypothetical protein